jgi:hypothetical protein
MAQTAHPLFQSPSSHHSIKLDPKKDDEKEEGYA